VEHLAALLHVVGHLDQQVVAWVNAYGPWAYVILCAIVFGETGLVVMPFLPGDSLLFVTGAVCATGAMDVHVAAALLVVSAFLGNLVNFKIGEYFGARLVNRPDSWFFRREYLDRTHAFYERHGGKTVVISRFMPIIRTYAPFVAGLGTMPTRRFAAFNLLGAVLWVGSFLYAGYFFGNIPGVKQNLTLLVLAIVAISLLPAVIGFLRARRA
jgi:membrane-associated protein